MTLNEYQKAAERTSGNLSPWDKISNGCYGLNGEAGECIDLLKKVEFQGHDFNPDKLLDELGDVLWYVAQTATGLGVPLEAVAHFIECDIEHDVQPNKNKPDKTITFARLADKRPSDGWDDQAAPAPATPKKAAPAASQAAPAAPKSKSDLMALLG